MLVRNNKQTAVIKNKCPRFSIDLSNCCEPPGAVTTATRSQRLVKNEFIFYLRIGQLSRSVSPVCLLLSELAQAN